MMRKTPVDGNPCRPGAWPLASALVASLALLACSPPPERLAFPATFEWGVATAAHQTEGGNTNNNWHQFETLPEFRGKTAEPSGDGVGSYRLFDEDAQRAASLGVSVFRLSLEWSRIEPRRGVFDEDALRHYDDVLLSLKRRGLRPAITLHHFTDPIWVNDLRQHKGCLDGSVKPSDTNLCGWQNPEVAVAFERFVEHVVKRYADRVDLWITINEPMAVLVTGWLFGFFPPGLFAQPWPSVTAVLRNLLEAHARAAAVIKRIDTKDADGDGRPAEVGFSQSVAWYLPAQPDRAEHHAAAEQGAYFMNHLFIDALVHGGLDTDLDGRIDEPHPSWKGSLDFVGLQYYYRTYTAKLELMPPLIFVPCMRQLEDFLPGAFRTLGCPAPDPQALTPMGYEHEPLGLFEVSKQLAARHPQLAQRITENGISTRNGRRRAESIVRHLQQVHRLLADGVDLRGYYHWSLLDNFEWAEGYRQRFGLFSVDRSSPQMTRSPTEGATVYGQIVRQNALEGVLRERYGQGPLSPEITP